MKAFADVMEVLTEVTSTDDFTEALMKVMEAFMGVMGASADVMEAITDVTFTEAFVGAFVQA